MGQISVFLFEVVRKPDDIDALSCQLSLNVYGIAIF